MFRSQGLTEAVATVDTMPSVILEIDTVPKFAFLALPPPPKRKRAVVNDALGFPASSVNCSTTISAWAKTVHPGSPAPMTPVSGVPHLRSTSFSSSPILQAFRRTSLTCARFRRQSASSTSNGIPSASFLHVSDTPRTPVHPIPTTPFPADAKFDFAAFGYASIFVDVPVSTPITPETHKHRPMTRLPSRRDATASPPTMPLTKSNGTGRLKRLLGSKHKAKSQTHHKGAAEKLDPVVSDDVPVSLKNCSAYAGKSIRQVMEKVRREGGPAGIDTIGRSKVIEGVETVHRDGLGGIWRDQEVEWEFAHPLASNKTPLSARCSDAEGWVTFNHLKEFEKDDFSEFSSLRSSKHTDLYHSRPLVVTGETVEQLACGRVTRCSSVAGSIVLPSPSVKPSKILLAIPSRPTRGRHLQPGFLRDVIAVPPTPSTPSAFSHTSSHPPRSPAHTTRFIVNASATSGPARRQRSRSRSLPRRQRKPAPPPLKIIPICSVNKLAVNVDPEEEGRKAFLEDSFRPGHIIMASRWSMETTPPQASPGDSDTWTNHFALVNTPKKSRRLGGFFKNGERKC